MNEVVSGSGADAPRSTSALLGRLLRTVDPPWGRLGLATLLGLAGVIATMGLMAGSGAVVVRAAFRPGLGAIAGLLAGVEVLAVIRAPLRYRERLVGHDAAFRVLARWRVWLYDHFEPLSPAGLKAWRSGDLLERAIEDVDTLQDLYLRAIPPVLIGLAAGAMAVVIVGIEVPAATWLLVVTLGAALVVPPALASAARRSGEREAQLRGDLAADTVDLLQGGAELLAFGASDDALGRLERRAKALGYQVRRRAWYSGAAGALGLLFLGLAVIVVLGYGIDAVHNHRLDRNLLAVLPLAVMATFEGIAGVTMAAGHLGNVAAAGRRLLAIERVPVPVTDPADPSSLPGGCPEISIKDVRLRYSADQPYALDGLNLRVTSGAKVALIGPNGSGKSSLVNVLLRFWPLVGGTVLLGAVPIDHLSQRDVRQTIAWLDQEADLFSGTIADNVRLARPSVSEHDIESVLVQAQLGEWLDSLPAGSATEVGEHGNQVSGGQRQRIALARALLASSPILVLDEPTAGLDEPTAMSLVDDIVATADQTGQSVLMVTHDFNRLSGFDHVITVRAGRVVEESRAERPPLS